ncbi:MAG TPA: MBL fold metallo-hydrolase [Fimbriimonadaceae bacterium]|nr:MBL fold metallo-hydrolase [Fimbriimonadaceae bacterium]
MRGRLKAIFIGGGLAAAAAALSPLLNHEQANLTFLAVGQGDCTVFRTGGLTVLIDAGPAGEGFDAGKSIIAPELRRMGVQVIDLILISHPDSDHIGGLPQIAKRFRVGKVVAPAAFKGHQALLESYRSAGLSTTQIGWLSDRSSANLNGFELTLDTPRLDAGERDNEGSMFVKVGQGESAVVFTGDANEETELSMLGRGSWRGQILKAGHHGSRFSTSLPWLRAVRPQHVILSCGRRNIYGHPAKDTLQRIGHARASAHRTDWDGHIRFSFRSGEWHLVR